MRADIFPLACAAFSGRDRLTAVCRCSDGWADRPDVAAGVEEHIAGGVSMKLYSPEIGDFDDYYFRLKPHDNARNPWFQEFWQERFRCYIDGADRDTRYSKRCTGCLLYTSPSPRDRQKSRMPSSA